MAMTTQRKIYVAGPNGFTDAGRLWHEQVVLPALATAGFDALDPWGGPADEWIARALERSDHDERLAALRDVNHRIGKVNRAMIDDCDAVLANLEGTDVDSGTAAEVGYACGRGKPVFAFRPDFRNAGDNPGSQVNLQIEYFISASGGQVAPSLQAAIALLPS